MHVFTLTLVALRMCPPTEHLLRTFVVHVEVFTSHFHNSLQQKTQTHSFTTVAKPYFIRNKSQGDESRWDGHTRENEIIPPAKLGAGAGFIAWALGSRGSEEDQQSWPASGEHTRGPASLVMSHTLFTGTGVALPVDTAVSEDLSTASPDTKYAPFRKRSPIDCQFHLWQCW